MAIKWNQELQVIKDLIYSGKTLEKIASIYGVTKQAISAGLKVYCPEFFSVLRNENLIKNKEKREAYLIENYDRSEWFMSDLERQKKFRFRRKKQNNYKHEWTLEYQDIDWVDVCPILGIELNYFADSRSENSVSFDRVDNSKGYIKGNVKIVSWRANRIKNDGTAEEHRLISEFLTKSLVSDV